MEFLALVRYGKFGLVTLLSAILFFYTLLIIALIPSIIRAYQMANELVTPV